MLRACIFDLDGVIVTTDHYHFLSWRRLARHLGFDFTEKQNDKLKGISRMESLEFLLDLGGISLTQSEKVKYAEMKNQWYQEYIVKMDESEILPGAKELLLELKENQIKIAIGSGSKNAGTVLNAVKLTGWFDAIVDGRHIEKGKPDPEVFIKAARQLDVSPPDAIVFEDSYFGISAANEADFVSIGIGDKALLNHADCVLRDLSDVNLKKIREVYDRVAL